MDHNNFQRYAYIWFTRSRQFPYGLCGHIQFRKIVHRTHGRETRAEWTSPSTKLSSLVHAGCLAFLCGRELRVTTMTAGSALGKPTSQPSVARLAGTACGGQVSGVHHAVSGQWKIQHIARHSGDAMERYVEESFTDTATAVQQKLC